MSVTVKGKGRVYRVQTAGLKADGSPRNICSEEACASGSGFTLQITSLLAFRLGLKLEDVIEITITKKQELDFQI